MPSITTYVTDEEIDDWFQGVTEDSSWNVTDDMPSIIRGVAGVSEGTAFSFIRECIDTIYCDPSLQTLTFLINGEGFPTIFSSIAPITQLDEVTIINSDGSEVTLDLSGINRAIFWDSSTGKITLIRNGEALSPFYELENSVSGQRVFPQGQENIRVVGNFGFDVPALAKLAELLVMMKHLQMQNPEKYLKIGNRISEKIGRYEYKLGAISSGAWSQTKSLDFYIEEVLEKLRNINSMGLEAI